MPPPAGASFSGRSTTAASVVSSIAAALAAVSYTHLDVYKRQVYDFAPWLE